MIVFKKAKSSVFDILNMKPIQIGTIIESQNLAKNYEKTEKISDQNYYRSGTYDHIEVPACRRVAEVRTLYGSVPGCRI